MLGFIFRMFTNKRFLICYGAILLLFICSFNVEFSWGILILLLIVVFVLSLPATVALNAVLAIAHVTVSYSRAKQLAEQFPQLAEIERQRGHLTAIKLVFVIVAVPLIVAGIIFGGEIGGIITLVIAGLFYFLVILEKEITLQKSFKELTVLDALSQTFDHIEFDAHRCFPQKELNDLYLIQGFDTMSGNDWIKAERKGIAFCRSDVHIQEERITQDSDGDDKTTYVTTFQGTVMRFEQQQSYPAHLTVITEGFPNVRTLSEDFKKLTGMVNDSSVETELDAFNRLFDAYSADQVAARMILTPQMMEGMLRLRSYTNYELAFVFDGNFMYLFISMPNVDSFELAVSSHKSVREQQKAVTTQVNYIAGLIDNMYFKEASHV